MSSYGGNASRWLLCVGLAMTVSLELIYLSITHPPQNCSINYNANILYLL